MSSRLQLLEALPAGEKMGHGPNYLVDQSMTTVFVEQPVALPGSAKHIEGVMTPF